VTLDEFAETTRFIIANEGIRRFLPTACYPGRRHITVLPDLPPEANPDKAVVEWAAREATPNEEFLVAFAVDPHHFKVIRTVGPFSEDEIYPLQDQLDRP
jgi:hypothetical protein